MARRVAREEYEHLCRMIKKWNENRLELFEITLPNEVRSYMICVLNTRVCIHEYNLCVHFCSTVRTRRRGVCPISPVAGHCALRV